MINPFHFLLPLLDLPFLASPQSSDICNPSGSGPVIPDQISLQMEQLPTNPSSNSELTLTITNTSDFDMLPSSDPDPTLQILSITIPEEISPNTTTPSPSLLHPVIETLRENDMGRNILVLVIPLAIFLLTKYHSLQATLALTLPLILLSLGFTFIWNGILLRPILERASNGIEILGISLVLLALFGVVAFFLPLHFIWFPFLCWMLALFPFIIAFFKRGRDEIGEPRGAHARSSIPLLPLSS